MLTLLAAAALAPVKFPGGNPNDFAALLAESAKQNVIVVQGEGQMVEACEYDPSDLNELSRALRNQTKLMIMPGTDLILSDGYISRQLVRGNLGRMRSGSGLGSDEQQEVAARLKAMNDARAASGSDKSGFKLVMMSPVQLPANAVKDGMVTFQTKKSESLDLMALGNLSKPVKTHWIFGSAVVACKVDNLPELDFLKWIAKGVGGRIVSGPKEYTLDIDPGEIRRRAIKTISLNKPTGGTPEETARLQKQQNFRISCLNALTPTQLSAALATENGETRVELDARSPLTRTAVAYVQEMEQSGDRRNPRVSVLQRVDPSRKAYLIVTSGFDTSVEVPILNGQGQPAGVVRF